MRSSRIWGIIKADVIIVLLLSLNACFVSKKTQAANNGTVWNWSETLKNKPIRLRKNIFKTIVRLQGQSIYDKMNHNVVYLFSIYDEMTHNVVYLFSTPNLGNYQADMTISPLALTNQNS